MAKEYLIKDKDYEGALRDMGFCTLRMFEREQIDRLKEFTATTMRGIVLQACTPVTMQIL